MKKRIISSSFILGLILLMIFLAVKTNKTVTENINWQTKECELTGWSGNCTYLTYNDITYYFKTDFFDDKEAEKCVWKINNVLEYVDSVFPGDTIDDMKVYIGFQDGEVLDRKNVSIMDNASGEYDSIWAILKKRNIDTLNSAEQYGLLYAYGVKNGIIQEKISRSEKKKIQEQLNEFLSKEENHKFMDFNIPMLETAYFTEEEAEMTKLAAKQFAVWYVEQYSIQELENLCKEVKNADTGMLEQRKNEWLTSIGCTVEYKEFSKILFQCNNYTDIVPRASYKIEAEDCVWLWDDEDVTTYGYEYMVENYNRIEPLREEDFAEAREYLSAYLPDKLEKVKIKTNFAISDTSSISEYVVARQTIEVPRGWEEAPFSLLHEYCHYLTVGEGKLLDSKSVFLEWYSTGLSGFILQNKEVSLLTKYIDKEYLRELGIWNDKDNCCQLSTLYKRGAMRMYYEKKSQNENKESFFVSFGGLSYGERGTLFFYVTETYGVEKMIELGKHEDTGFEEVLGITFQELYFDMIDWLKPQMEDDEWLKQKLEEEGYNLQI